MKRRRRMKTNLAGVSKGDFVEIARVFCKHSVPEGAARELASYFARENPRFDRERFIAATRKC